MATQIMGVLNVTPDSFSDGGLYQSIDAALSHVEAMITAGADYIDIGGQSSRPGATMVSSQVESERVIPIIRAISQRFPEVKLSLDTFVPAVVEAALAYPIYMLNDITALADAQNRYLVKQSGIRVCLMHMQNNPATMQDNPQYDQVTSEVFSFLEARITSCLADGIKPEQLLIDPGFGFGKSISHNLQLLASLPTFTALSCPILVGLSRKSMLGALTGRPVDQRLHAGLAAAVIAIINGASIIRTHDVAATKDAIAITDAYLTSAIMETI